MRKETVDVKLILPSSAISRLSRGVASTGLGQIISAAKSILLMPLFLKAWGADGYGKWLILTALVSYVSLIDLGGQLYIGNIIAREYVRGSKDRFIEQLSEGTSLFALLAFAVFCVLLAFVSLPELTLPGYEGALNLSERLILLFMGSAFLMAVPGGVWVQAYRATGLFVRGTIVGNILNGIGFLCYAAILALGASPMIYAASFLVATTVGTLYVIWDVRQRIPECRSIRLSLTSAWAGRIHLSGSVHFWSMALATGLKQQAVIIVLGAAVSPVVVALYATHRTITGLMNYVSSMIQPAIWPEMTFLDAQVRRNELTRILLLTIRLVVFLSCGAALALMIFGPLIYPIWTDRELHFHPTLMALLVIQIILSSGWNTSIWSLLASNQHRKIAYWSLANSLLTVVVAIVLAPQFGVLGVASAGLVGDMVCGVVAFPWLASRVMGLPVARIYQAMFIPILAMIPVGIILLLAASFFHGTLLVLVAGVIVGVFIYPTAYLALGKGEDVKWALEKFRGLWRERAQASKRSA